MFHGYSTDDLMFGSWHFILKYGIHPQGKHGVHKYSSCQERPATHQHWGKSIRDSFSKAQKFLSITACIRYMYKYLQIKCDTLACRSCTHGNGMWVWDLIDEWYTYNGYTARSRPSEFTPWNSSSVTVVCYLHHLDGLEVIMPWILSMIRSLRGMVICLIRFFWF